LYFIYWGVLSIVQAHHHAEFSSLLLLSLSWFRMFTSVSSYQTPSERKRIDIHVGLAVA